MSKTNTGFTLIEILVVISIIGLLIGLSFFALKGARQGARDSARKADLEQIRSGLELYRADCGVYPDRLRFGSSLNGTDGSSHCSCCRTNVYIKKIPDDPQANRNYYYSVSGNRMSYVVCAALEKDSGPVSGCGSCGSAACNYKVESP